MIYKTDSDSQLIITHWLAKVSHHHYYFETHAELIAFFDDPLYDPRMSIANPVGTFAEFGY